MYPQLLKKDGENFEEWRRDVLDCLRILDIDGFVEGTETPPAIVTREDKRNFRVFHERRRCALAIIFCSSWPVHLSLKYYGFDCTVNRPTVLGPKAMWDAIHRWDLAVHLRTTDKMELVKELRHIQHSQFDSLSEFMRRVDWLHRRLERAGMPIADELMKTHVRNGLIEHPDDTWIMLLLRQVDDWTYWDLRKYVNERAYVEKCNERQAAQAQTNKPQRIKGHRNSCGRRQRSGARQRASPY